MSAHVAGEWWGIERFDTERREWRLQWEPNKPCWPRLFTRRHEVRAYITANKRPLGPPGMFTGRDWMDIHWRLRPVKVRVVRA